MCNLQYLRLEWCLYSTSSLFYMYEKLSLLVNDHVPVLLVHENPSVKLKMIITGFFEGNLVTRGNY